MQSGDISSDVIGQFHYLVLRIQDLHGLCVRVVTDRERPGDFGSKFPASEQNNLGLMTIQNYYRRGFRWLVNLNDEGPSHSQYIKPTLHHAISLATWIANYIAPCETRCTKRSNVLVATGLAWRRTDFYWFSWQLRQQQKLRNMFIRWCFSSQSTVRK